MGQANTFQAISSPDTKTVQKPRNMIFQNEHGKKVQIGILILLLATNPNMILGRRGQK